MTYTGDITCAEKLLQPARIVLKSGTHIRKDPYERRVALWNEVRTNQDRFLREECGTFLEEVDLHMRSQFDAALVALAAAFDANREDFSHVSRFSSGEIRTWQQVERYNLMEILSPDDMRNRLMKKDAGLLALFQEYYRDMDRYVETTLDDPEIRLTLRYYLKHRWNGYRGKMDAAIADAVTRFDWMQELVMAWEKEKDRP